MRKNGMSLTDAIKFVRDKRDIICPNDGFMEQLATFEEKCKVEASKNKQD
jgi:hypothetical protein